MPITNQTNANRWQISERTKVGLLATAGFLLFIICSWGIQRLVVYPQFVELEHQEAARMINRGISALDKETNRIFSLTRDWAIWDDLYAFVADGNQAFVKSNLQLNTFKETGMVLVGIVDLQGQWKALRIYDPKQNVFIQMKEFKDPRNNPDLRYFIQHRFPTDHKKGLVMTSRGIMLLVSHPILTSDAQGPIRGTLIMGEFLSNDLVKKMQEQEDFLAFNISFLKDSAFLGRAAKLTENQQSWPAYIFEGQKMTRVFSVLHDALNKNKFLVEVDMPREITHKGMRVSTQAFFVLIFVGMLILSLVFIVIDIRFGQKASSEKISLQEERHLTGVLLVGLMGLLVTVYLFTFVREQVRSQMQDDFVNMAKGDVEDIEEIFTRHQQILNAINLFYQSSQSVTSSEFATFTESLMENNPSILFFQWSPFVKESERQGFEESARQHGMAGFEIAEINKDGQRIPAGVRPEYYPAYYIAPLRGYEIALGLDVGADAKQLAVLTEARDLGQPILEGPFQLVRTLEKSSVALFVYPVYQKNNIDPSVEKRRSDLQGFIVEGLRPHDLIASGIGSENSRAINYKIYYNSPAGEKVFFYQEDDAQSLAGHDGQKKKRPTLSHEFVFDFAGRSWHIIAQPNQKFYRDYTGLKPWAVLLGGIILVILLMQYLLSVQSLRQRAETLAMDRMKELSFNEKRLYDIALSCGQFIWEVDTEGRYTYATGRTNILGYTNEEILMKTCYDLICPEYVEEIRAFCQKTALEKKPIIDMENWNYTKDGRRVCLLTNAFPIIDEHGQVVGYRGVDKDITEFKVTQSELKWKNEELMSMTQRLMQREKELEGSTAELEERIRQRTADLEAANASLEDRVTARTRELQDKNIQLEKHNAVMAGRELRIIELKERIRDLEERLALYKGKQINPEQTQNDG